MKAQLKKKILSVITKTLDAHASSPEIDRLLADSVEKVLDAEKPPMTAVQYIGKRGIYSDSLYNTGMWIKEQIKLVEVKVANKMLDHPDVYVKAEAKDDEGLEIATGEQPAGDYDETLYEGRQAVMSMQSEEDIRSFVASNFTGAKLELPKDAGIDEMRLEAIRMIDMYHLPETAKEEKSPVDDETLTVIEGEPEKDVSGSEVEKTETEPQPEPVETPVDLEAISNSINEMKKKQDVVDFVEKATNGEVCLELKANDTLPMYKEAAIKVFTLPKE